MPLTPYLGSFDPEDIAVLMSAFDEAWQQIQHVSTSGLAEAEVKDRLAQIIVRRAKTGSFDKDALVVYALSAFQPAGSTTAIFTHPN